MNVALIATIIGVFFIFTIVLFIASRIVRCPANRILVIQGQVGDGRAVTCVHGGLSIVWPLIQTYDYLDLTPMTISIPLKGALSQQNIRVNVPSTFTIAVDNNPENMTNAAVRLLDLTAKEIESMAMEIIFGQLRLTIASLTIEEINQDRERFLAAIRNNIQPELQKIGLTLINVNITDITDESGYIESIGKKAASTAINQAKIDVAEQTKKGDIGSAEADKERRIQVAAFDAAAVEGENKAKAEIAQYNALLAEKEAEARQRGMVADQKAEAEIQHARAETESKRLNAEEVIPREIEKRKVEIDAEAKAQKLRKEAAGQADAVVIDAQAQAEKKRREAAGEADAILSVQSAEAEGLRKILDAKAEGFNNIVASCASDPKQAATMLMVEKLEDIVKLQTEAIRNIKIDRITVWDGGNGEGGSSTANFMSNLIKSLPPLHDVAKVAGLELPEYLGKVKAEENKADK